MVRTSPSKVVAAAAAAVPVELVDWLVGAVAAAAVPTDETISEGTKAYLFNEALSMQLPLPATFAVDAIAPTPPTSSTPLSPPILKPTPR